MSDGHQPLVGIAMGSASDLATLQPAADILERFGVAHELRVLSAHRTPDAMADYARSAARRGLKVLIAGAGGAAHLPGMLAASTPLPVIGVPVSTTTLSGLDALLSIVQMPRGVPVATVAIGGGVNAGLLAVQILATHRCTTPAAPGRLQSGARRHRAPAGRRAHSGPPVVIARIARPAMNRLASPNASGRENFLSTMYDITSGSVRMTDAPYRKCRLSTGRAPLSTSVSPTSGLHHAQHHADDQRATIAGRQRRLADRQEHAPQADHGVVQHQRERNALMELEHSMSALKQLGLLEVFGRHQHQVDARLGGSRLASSSSARRRRPRPWDECAARTGRSRSGTAARRARRDAGPYSRPSAATRGTPARAPRRQSISRPPSACS